MQTNQGILIGVDNIMNRSSSKFMDIALSTSGYMQTFHQDYFSIAKVSRHASVVYLFCAFLLFFSMTFSKSSDAQNKWIQKTNTAGEVCWLYTAPDPDNGSIRYDYTHSCYEGFFHGWGSVSHRFRNEQSSTNSYYLVGFPVVEADSSVDFQGQMTSSCLRKLELNNFSVRVDHNPYLSQHRLYTTSVYHKLGSAILDSIDTEIELWSRLLEDSWVTDRSGKAIPNWCTPEGKIRVERGAVIINNTTKKEIFASAQIEKEIVDVFKRQATLIYGSSSDFEYETRVPDLSRPYFIRIAVSGSDSNISSFAVLCAEIDRISSTWPCPHYFNYAYQARDELAALDITRKVESFIEGSLLVEESDIVANPFYFAEKEVSLLTVFRYMKSKDEAVASRTNGGLMLRNIRESDYVSLNKDGWILVRGIVKGRSDMASTQQSSFSDIDVSKIHYCSSCRNRMSCVPKLCFQAAAP